MKTNSRLARNVYAVSDIIWCNKHLRHTTTEKYDNNRKGGYFRFDYDNNMSYRYIISITYTEMSQLNTYNPIYCNEIKGNRWDLQDTLQALVILHVMSHFANILNTIWWSGTPPTLLTYVVWTTSNCKTYVFWTDSYNFMSNVNKDTYLRVDGVLPSQEMSP